MPTPVALPPITNVAQYLAALVTYIRANVSTDDLRQVRLYAGEFDHEEIKTEKFNAPCVFVTCMGWQHNPASQKYATNTRSYRVKYALFVVTKHASGRVDRFELAVGLCEMLTALVIGWKPKGCVGEVRDSMTCENLFSRKVDEHQMGLWMLDWWQEQEIQPHAINVPRLYDWLGLSIDSTYLTQAPPTPHPAGTAPITPQMPEPCRPDVQLYQPTPITPPTTHPTPCPKQKNQQPKQTLATRATHRQQTQHQPRLCSLASEYQLPPARGAAP